MACEGESRTHWVGCDCVLEKLNRYKRLLKQLRMVITTLTFYADGGQDGGGMAGLTLGAYGADLNEADRLDGEAAL